LWSPYPPGSADLELGERAGAQLTDFNLNDDSVGIEDEGRYFRVRPETFVQVNAWLRDDLFRKAIDFLAPQPDERIIDAYAGIGMLSARIATRTGEVVCIEESPYAVRLGELNAELNGCRNIRYLRGRVEDVLNSAAGPIDGVVLDPPRAGCAETAIKAIVEAEPKRIVYLSCEPSTLARDLARFSESRRYTLSDVALVDMFPQTYHFETVVKLVRNT
jgi:23S rRNA (uracil1939-C5)-methyltransferase